MDIKKYADYTKKVYKKLKDPFWRAKSRYVKYYNTLSIDDKLILVESQHGKEINGNVFYILKYISENKKYSDYKVYVTARVGNAEQYKKLLQRYNLGNIHITILSSDEYFKVLSSAKYLINDNTFLPFFMKKEGQIYLNTWHGTPLKTLGRLIQNDTQNIGNTQKNFLEADYLLFPNEHTKKCILEDYMLENISSGKYILSGYPRNEIFFDNQESSRIKEKFGLDGKRIYVYMPTFRGVARNVGSSKSDAYLLYYLCELDKQLKDDEILYVNLHPIAKKNIKFNQFKKIRNFPEEYETYDFLNIADVLITDYSSVFFDFAITTKKIVLFTYDEEEYLAERGMYLELSDLPFPRVKTLDNLLDELRTPKEYDDTGFCSQYCKYENVNASQKLCDYVILGEETGLDVRDIPDNGRENVLIYAGNLASNGITMALRNLINVIDLKKRNYYITFIQDHVGNNNAANLKKLAEHVSYYATTGDMNVTILERLVRKLFKKKIIPAKLYMKLLGRRIMQDFYRQYGHVRVDSVIHYNGYEAETMLGLSVFNGKKSIFVHSDMIREIETKGNQRADVLNYVYNKYDNVAVVTSGMLDSTNKLAKKEKGIIVKNAIDYSGIIAKSKENILLDLDTKLSCSYELFEKIIKSEKPKIINIGRFSPEKGHDRLVQAFNKLYLEKKEDIYLIIMGGYSIDDGYQKLLNQVNSLGLADRVILLEKVSNPYPILNACNYFILSSHYEGFGLVLVEADILGKSVVSTDIVGPRAFMKEHGGTLVENSEEGIYHGLEILLSGQVKPMTVDYDAYNESVKREFELLFDRK